ncbi:hypothetical protein DL769_005370 [Monosporascus sp. CRB-8-3]|nr:hypothetical protein DL769_005370 [Monosporascus sp. CRB-8-3]
MSIRYDAIIVGGGVAGLVAATRLSEDATKRILVIEAGKDHRGDPQVDIPGMLLTLWGNPEYDWNFWTVPQQGLDGREVPQPQGKILGGSSAINATAMLYPTPRNFESWSKLGNRGWTAEDMIPYYRKSMKYYPPSRETKDLLGLESYYQPELYGTDGPISASIADGFGPYDVAFISSIDSTGLSKKSDPFLGRQHGPFTPLTSVDPRTRKRAYAASSYYTSLAEGRENLELLVETYVNKLILHRQDNGLVEAKGVEIVKADGSTAELYGKSVILAAGTFQTPLVLERSGIGSKMILERHGIEVVMDSPGVGENFRDHVYTSISLEVNDGLVTRDAVRDPAVVETYVNQYRETQSGPLAGVPLNYAVLPCVDGGGLIQSRDLETLIDRHIGLDDSNLVPGAKAQLSELRNILLDSQECALYFGMLPGQHNIMPGGRTSMVEMHAPLRPENFLSISVGLNNPLSRGSIHIGSKGPVINPAYLSHPLDLEILSRGVQYLETIASQDGFKKLIKQGGIRLPSYAVDVGKPEVAKQVAKERAWTNYHPVGTCAMMPKELGGVIDDRLLVYGTSNIRIIDASIFPMITMGNIQATVYAVAEKACDLIKEDWGKASRNSQIYGISVA